MTADGLASRNAPWEFWRIADPTIGEETWHAAAQAARSCLQGLPAADTPGDALATIASVLTEGQFGPDHFHLSTVKRVYYALRPYLPAAVRPLLHRVSGPSQRRQQVLDWPIEDRYVRHQFELVRQVVAQSGRDGLPYLHFWPEGRRFALVLTHDIETSKGQRFARAVADLEESLGFRSSFNFVAEDYAFDQRLAAELDQRGFEIGLHGLRHDGKSFTSRKTFQAQAVSMNRYLADRRATGFRSPLTHRHPEWMQALQIEYDSSFFDTDPFEPMAGGTMSIWPFFLGHFVELPMTLAQDHTLLETAGESTPQLWLDKVAFIEQWCGMALVNTHPDYLQNPRYWTVYEQFLRNLADRRDVWHALPRDVARWWAARASAPLVRTDQGWTAPDLPDATVGRVIANGAAVELVHADEVRAPEAGQAA